MLPNTTSHILHKTCKETAQNALTSILKTSWLRLNLPSYVQLCLSYKIRKAEHNSGGFLPVRFFISIWVYIPYCMQRGEYKTSFKSNTDWKIETWSKVSMWHFVCPYFFFNALICFYYYYFFFFCLTGDTSKLPSLDCLNFMFSKAKTWIPWSNEIIGLNSAAKLDCCQSIICVFCLSKQKQYYKFLFKK